MFFGIPFFCGKTCLTHAEAHPFFHKRCSTKVLQVLQCLQVHRQKHVLIEVGLLPIEILAEM